MKIIHLVSNLILIFSGLSDGAMNQMGTDPRFTGAEENIPLKPLAVFGGPGQQTNYQAYKILE